MDFTLQSNRFSQQTSSTPLSETHTHTQILSILYTVLYSQWILEGSFIVCLAMNSVRMDSWLNRTENFIHVEKNIFIFIIVIVVAWQNCAVFSYCHIGKTVVPNCSIIKIIATVCNEFVCMQCDLITL